MLVYRICRSPHQALDGEGARLHGGRWNSEGTPMVYAATSLSLAALEYLVHVDPDLAPPDLVALTIELPADAPIGTVDATSLPADWQRTTEHPDCQALGDAWARRNGELALRVPSALVPEERNVVINPRHPSAGRLRVVSSRPFAFDPRLVG